ncbi:PREDICTED: tat-linked quality control protein TatD-like isoform X2 [Priapulus caudatus]|nr:PREDICTED: tat-linked quality control protein TatD-like isoform X2 [Priapulus caudatus]XP_014677328.1 PREDICTED: tat-linked quality control protein TatD-like isoform X2 [Priapulus caudatus]
MFSDRTRVVAPHICLDDLYQTCDHTDCERFGDVKYVDSHCHLDLINDNEKINPQSITYPRQFAGAVTNFCFPDRWKKAPRYVASWIHRTIGVHPKLADRYADDSKIRHEMEMIIREAEGGESRIVAVGECGMDLRYKGADAARQEKLFRWQCDVARGYDLPLVIHSGACSDAHIRLTRSALPPDYPIHVHCFTYTPEEAFKWLSVSKNLYLGLTGYATQEQHADGTGAVAANPRIPLERLLLETDSPMNKPVVRLREVSRKVPLCHPGHALNVACEIAARRRVGVAEVLQTTTANFQRLYRVEID